MEPVKATLVWRTDATVVRCEEYKTVIALGDGIHISFPIGWNHNHHVKPGDTVALTLDLTQVPDVEK